MSALENFSLDDIPGAENVEVGSDIYWDLAQRYLHQKRRDKKTEEKEKKKKRKST